MKRARMVRTPRTSENVGIVHYDLLSVRAIVVIGIQLHGHRHESATVRVRHQSLMEVGDHLLSSMGGREYAHRVEVGPHQFAEVCSLPDGARKPSQTVAKLHIVAVLCLSSVGGLSLHDGGGSKYRLQ